MNWCHCAHRVPRGVSTQFYESGHQQPRGTNFFLEKKRCVFVTNILAKSDSGDMVCKSFWFGLNVKNLR